MSAVLGVAEPEWLAVLRAAAMERYIAQGLPTAKNEAWRFCNLRGLAVPATTGTAKVSLNAASLPAGVRFQTLSGVLAQTPDWLETCLAMPETADGFTALNLAMFQDGFVLEVPAGVQIKEPLEILQESQDGAVHLRGLVVLGEGAEATLVERVTGSGWTNNVTHIALAPGARLRHAKLQAKQPGAVHVSATSITLGEEADHESVVLALGGGVTREAVSAVLAGERANFSLRGAYLLGGKQEASFVPEALHLAPNCTSCQVVKGVLADTAHGIFLGHIGVPEGADGTDANQGNHNILLSAGARVDTRPRLEILADDVKCRHGATVGDLDETALFYLQSRGLPPQAARRMLIEAFAADILDGADLLQTVRDGLAGAMSAWAETLA
ncbi:Fe-S cluster assembly protein SufD [Acidocella sp.]|uniref:Fe-S cluster assembly protein SufD n=1 Tax=Acidocella sp. TaxID=50710 RepID=UPI003D030442